MLLSGLILASALAFDAGADFRVRQETMGNVPGLVGGGFLSKAERGKTQNHWRYRVRTWGEAKLDTERHGKWRVYARLADEFRWNVNYRNRKTEFPDELIVDNLFLEGIGLVDGFLDFRIGRQDLYGLFGLPRIFGDGTPMDGSRTTFSDMIRATLHFDETSGIDLFALANRDRNDLRWGTSRSRNRRLVALDPSAEPEMNDWGFGAIWNSEFSPSLPYKLFAMHRRVSAWHDARGAKHPGWHRSLVGFNLRPKLSEDLSLELEGMAQAGRNSLDDILSAWSAYIGAEWRKASAKSWRPYVKSGLQMNSGDRDAASEDGGNRAWDPMWARCEYDSCLFHYGTLYSAGFWSNMYFWKNAIGVEISPRHVLEVSTGPIFADRQDGLGGGDGMYKGLLSQATYTVPLLTADRARNQRLDILCSFVAELFNPDDYYATDKPSWFLRWQVEIKF